ncbi:efflux transporter, RND family, MFP subunit [Desulfofarcimen acetoxidans DSM 771]|uniref:Efflux transporter, RND family, MFP subunit n=1 Tax=Desulfofarcimen acetoxidans (strain ATCC 49208 / DSM 771 / KCTC 5769 / VKM B-1644 / 5575) TaxID=485916 RepID=C8W2J2_DESAS|nr:efflux RND transporter periplasmic adaptor subunit [Desulfofarcimen acetoxidans]ACV63676.1 efflux transporter, RND family, MFP subunit [Desulfofarcimen acetoxidans DSM 771]
MHNTDSAVKQPNKILALLKGKKFLFRLLAILAVGLVGAYFFQRSNKTEVSYITDTVKKGSVTNTIPATGTIEPVSTVSLSFENAEVIKKIYVKTGDPVTAGQLLAEQEEDSLQAQLTQSSASLKSNAAKLALLKKGSTEEEIAKAESSVKVARSAYELVKSKLDKNQKLLAEKVISQTDFDDINNEFISAEGNLKQAEEALKSLQKGNRIEEIEQAEAQVESSNAQLKIAQKDLAGTKMISPMDGIVSEVNGGEGQRATANNNSTSSGTGFIVLISKSLQVEAQVNEADIGKLEIGQTAEFTVNSYPNKVFTGKVSSISPEAETVSNVQVYNIIIQLEGEQQELKAGMPANLNIIINKKENTLTVPKGAVTYATSYLSKNEQSTALKTEATGNQTKSSNSGNNSGSSKGSIRSGSGQAATTSGAAKESSQKTQTTIIGKDESGKPVSHQVLLGLSDSKNYEILEGLNEGDIVIVGDSSATSTGTASTSKSSSGGGGLLGGGGPPR